jgi:hypothetical protein
VTRATNAVRAAAQRGGAARPAAAPRNRGIAG